VQDFAPLNACVCISNINVGTRLSDFRSYFSRCDKYLCLLLLHLTVVFYSFSFFGIWLGETVLIVNGQDA